MICSRCGRSGHTSHRCKLERHFQKCCKTKLKKDKAKQGKTKVHWVESASGDVIRRMNKFS